MSIITANVGVEAEDDDNGGIDQARSLQTARNQATSWDPLLWPTWLQ